MKKETSIRSVPDVKTLLAKLDAFLELYLIKKVPNLPENIKEFIVKVFPYLSIVAIIFSIPGLLILLGLSTYSSPVYVLGGARYTFGSILSLILLLATLVLEGMAIPGLFSRKASSWKLIFYVALVNAVSALLSFNLGNLIIGTAISLYFIYQIKSYYKK